MDQITKSIALVLLSLAFTSPSWANGELPAEEYKGKVRVCYAAQDIPAGRVLGVYEINEELLKPEQVKWKDSCSQKECIGKIARQAISNGTRLTPEQLTSPTEPATSDKWLLHYSNDDLQKLVGKTIVIKGSLMVWSLGASPRHHHAECAVVSVDDNTCVRIALTREGETVTCLQCKADRANIVDSELQAAAAQRVKWLQDSSEVVIVSGVLSKAPTNIPIHENYSTSYFLDQKTVTITPSVWCTSKK